MGKTIRSRKFEAPLKAKDRKKMLLLKTRLMSNMTLPLLWKHQNPGRIWRFWSKTGRTQTFAFSLTTRRKNCCRHLKCCQSRVKNCCVGSAGPYDKIALLLQALLVLQLWIVKNVHFVALLVDTSCSWLIALLLTHRGGKARDSKLVHGTNPKKAWPRTSL